MNQMGLLPGMGGMGMGMDAMMGADQPLADSAEVVYISSLALLKMLKHGMAPRATLWNNPNPCASLLSFLYFNP